ncbi:MAG: NADH-quinone oxidoreductase subunit M [Pseudomonadota bacterium]
MENLLSILIFIPLLAALILAIFLRGDDDAAQRNAKWLAVTATGATFFMALILWFAFEPGTPDFQFVEERRWLFGVTYRVGVDGVSLAFVMVISAFMPLVVIASWAVSERVRDYIIALLTAETLFLGAVLSLDLAFLVLFFEAAIIPLAIMAGLWGKKGAGIPALKAVLYATPGAVLMVVALSALGREAGSTDLTAILRHNVSTEPIDLLGLTAFGGSQTLIVLGMAWSIAVKAPLWPFHTWLPDLAGKAPLPATMTLAGLGGLLAVYGVLRFWLPVLPAGVAELAPYMMALLLFGLLAVTLSALVQEHLRRLLAYLAAAFAAWPILALLTMDQRGIDGALLLMATQAFVLGGLFLAAVSLESRLRSDEFSLMGGIRLRSPLFAFLLLVLVLSAFGMPGTGVFIGLLLSVYGVVSASPVMGLLLALSAVPLAAVAMTLYRRVALGDALRESVRTLPRLVGRERLGLGLAAAIAVALGVWPGLLLDRTGGATSDIVAILEAAR